VNSRSLGAVRPGIEVLVRDRPELVRGSRIGLIAHPASVDRDLRHATQLLAGPAGADVRRLFAPEHGVTGGHQDMVRVDEARDPVSGLPVTSLYGDTEDSLVPEHTALANLEVLVCDLQDAGARYYTFAATIIRTLPVAAASGVRVVVADRPNPLGGVAVEGNIVEPAFSSFVGELGIANRHGMTLGEMCELARTVRNIDVDLTVVPAAGWRREQHADETGLPWVMPSPNMPALETALVYPGACLLEGTNLSEGRGTTRPFEIVGAPWLEPGAFAARLGALKLPGVSFRPLSFVPTFHKHRGEVCGGVQIHVTDRARFRPVATGLALVVAARAEAPEAFRWRTERYEFVDAIPAFDLLAGTARWRQLIERGAAPADISAEWGEDETKMTDLIRTHSLY